MSKNCRPLLEIKNFSYTFTENAAHPEVQGVSFNLYPNEFIGVIGESGSGKSVTAKAILQLNSSKGIALPGSQILYGGDNLLHLIEEKIRKIRGREISIVFQDPMVYLNPTATIGSQIDETLRLHFPNCTSLQRYEKTIELLHMVELFDAKNLCKRYPHELSGGMRQRVMIAIALSPNPRVFIADEITTALDVSVGREILILLKKLQKNLAMSVIFITHDLSIVTQFASRVIVMYKGQVMEQGATEEVCFSPKHPYTKGLIDSIPKIDSDPKEPLPVIERKRNKVEGACPFYHKCPYAKEECMTSPSKLTWEGDRGYLCHFPQTQKQEALCTPTSPSSK